MPKIYRDDERAYIKKRFMEEAAYCLSVFGIRRITIDMLVERVNIPKGTFYLFYESKEILLFEAMMEQHKIIEKQMFEEIRSSRKPVTTDRLTEIICKFFQSIDEIGLLRLLGTGEIELLYRKLPRETLENHLRHDDDIIHEIIKILSLSPKVNAAHFSSAFRNLFITTVYKREMGEEYFNEAFKLTLRGLVMQLMMK